MSIQERWRRLHASLDVARRFLPELRPYRGALLLVAVVTLAAVSMELLRPWPVKWIVDYALTGKQHSSHSPSWIIGWGAAAGLAIVLVDCGLDYLAAILTNNIARDVTRSLRFRVFDHLARLSPAFHARFKSGDLLVRLDQGASRVFAGVHRG